MQALERAMSVAALLADNENGGLSISELAQRSGLPLSTMHRMLKSMTDVRLAEQDETTKLYRLGPLWMEYGLRIYDSIDYISKIRPELERLAREVNESIYLSRPSGTEAVVMERIDSEHNPIRINDKLGLRIPMHIGAANKVMLAAMPDAESRKILGQLVPEETLPEWMEMLGGVRDAGYAESHGERTQGTSSVAVAVKDGLGSLIGAVSIGFISYDLSDDRLQFLVEKLKEAGTRIAVKLGAG
ncbi:IclR family transcriptional regulator [Edaphobacillus lindanitolerans]|uniref:Transcriptional regulator, IclR family n=1 Tax=Edaphobacillus lindanitolerans TaxID=550447 RepID=A0A1U7PP31_9BACI|nr:IclR family transcriptional regulator [Edaphobacillus lindanitolerans]SIT74777.1 transcriptional regulator, IclR family [Edaphobacillus lindanitolerans]